MRQVGLVIAAGVLLTSLGCESNGQQPGTGAADGDRLDELEQRVERIDKRLAKLENFIEQVTGGIPVEPDPAATYAVPISPLDPVAGAPDAAVTIIEGFDFA